ncbi:hypothetical protein SYK_06910 [Pseudodesulfovibrio nedwellii]|uniref:S24 family peptidase n=1 Tax=Pseudodesulfovibrio nedwellii TaxID=2973072 RepID=A0ABM8AYE7_9BACT|nr:S24/S26 family peptidase [Pseudodesulfovibrio nedwellii]BDQ36331.1 hypothetical protein SYK_06910 [Pseudodesulfovibrio nedwellii]
MGFHDDLTNGLKGLVGKDRRFKNNARLAEACDVAPIQISRIVKKEREQYIKALAKIIDGVGARLIFDDANEHDTAREVCFVDAQAVNAPDAIKIAEEDYIAVPLAEEPVAAGPGLIPQDSIRGWVLVWRHHKSLRFTTNLVAVQIGKNERSMLPTFCPEDILLIDRSNKNPEQPGKTWLVCDPDGGCAIKRVSTKPVDGDIELIFYSDNTQDFPPTSYRLKRDFDGNITRAIAGRVVWAWSDVRDK